MYDTVKKVTDAIVVSVKPNAATSAESFMVNPGVLVGGMFFLYFLIFVAVYVFLILIMSTIAQMIWNSVIPNVFSQIKPVESVSDMLGIIILGRIIFGR